MEHKAHNIHTNCVHNNTSSSTNLAYGALAPFHNQFPLTPVPSWKLYENPFYADCGHQVPKYIPHYLNPPLRQASNFVTTAANSHNLAADCGADSLITPANCGAHQPTLAPPAPTLISARKLAASFWKHREIHRLVQAPEKPAMLSDLVNKQVQQPNLPPSETLKRSSLHSDCKISAHAPEDNIEPGEAINMASNQATLANMLHRVRFLEENQSRSMATIAKLRLDMEDASSRIQELEFSHQSALREVNSLLQRFGDQMTISRRKEQEKVKLAFLHLREEMEEERNSCRLLQIQNKKLSKDLTEANIAAADACEELDRERKARELMEEVCNELAREIGEDKAEVEQLKQEQANSRERLEEELNMMRMAALWREERVRSKLSEAQLELDGKQYMHDLKSKLEAFVSTVGVNCKGSLEDIEKQVEQAKMLRQALDLLQLSEGEVEEKAKEAGSSIQHTSIGCSNACFNINKEKASCANQNDGEVMNNQEQIIPAKDSKKPRKLVRRPRSSGDDRFNASIRQQKVYDQPNSGFVEVHGNWHAGENEVEKKQSVLQDVDKKGMGVMLDQKNVGDDHIPVHSVSAELEDGNKMWLATEKKQKKEVTSVCGTSEQIKLENADSEQSLSYNALKGLHRKHLSLHFDAEEGEDHQLDNNTGSSLRHSFSEDDARCIAGRPGERQRSARVSITKQAEDMHQWKYAGHDQETSDDRPHDDHLDHDHDQDESAGGEDSELDDFYFEPVRAPSNSLDNNPSYVDDPVKVEKRNFCSTRDQARITAKSSYSSNEITKIHENVDGTTSATARYGGPEALGKGAASKSSSQESMKMVQAPSNSFQSQPPAWRSLSAGKPMQCFWPPSPDAFSIFAGANKRSKAISGQQMEAHPHKAEQQLQQYPQLQHDQQVSMINMKSNSLRAELLKARELENNKPAKASFRFSPLRRSASS